MSMLLRTTPIRVTNLKIGDKVRVQTRDRGIVVGGVTEVCPVTDNEPEGIKNGAAGICYDEAKGDGGWCYENQIVGMA